MAIDSYQTLVDAICDRMNDTGLETYAPEFIQLAEAMFNRRIFNLEAEGTATIAADVSVPLPSDFGSMKALWLATDPLAVLSQVSIDQLRRQYAISTTGKPQAYALASGEIIFGPAPDDAYTVTMVYQRTLTPLTATDTTNWLLEQHPDLYLYGALLQAEFRGWNDGRLPLINSALEGAISEINQAGNMKRTSTGIRMTPPVRWGI